MWQQRDPTLRISSKNNLIVRNLRKDLTTQELQALFSGSGNIISCKISKNVKGTSEGFGFVQMSTEEEVKACIKSFQDNPQMGETYAIEGKQLLVDLFEKSEIRHKTDTYNNLYVKNLPDDFDEDKLTELFSKFGKLSSVKLDTNPDGKSKGFG